jgi:hypothetical protein
MGVHSIVEDDVLTTKHSVRVDWFQRDPGGGTIFVMPVPESGAASSAGPRADEAAAGG